MRRMILAILAAQVFLLTPAMAVEQVVIDTSAGQISLELDDQRAPLTVANFLAYVDSGHYRETFFPRVIKNLMIQGGNFTADMSPKKTGEPIKNEAGNGLRNLRGTIAMARTGVVDSATSQFFINLKDNPFLDHKDNTPQGYGYAVFGQVTQGMDVVDKIGLSATGTHGRFRDVPVEAVVIHDIKRVAR